MDRLSTKVWKALFAVVMLTGLSLGLVACGGGGGGAQVTVSTGQVALLVTDGPTDEFDEINVRLERVELLGNGPPVSIFASQPGKLVDLLKLRGEAQLLELSDEVPAGTYDKIRLQVASVELVKLDANGVVLESHFADLPANGKIDLNPRGPFAVTAGGTLLIQLDLDANKAIHIVTVGQSQKYKFRPVVFVDIDSQLAAGKLVRLDGFISELGADEFLLCRQLAANSDDNWSGRCVAVRLLPETVIFNELGDSVGFNDLTLNDPIQVIGRFGLHEPGGETKVFASFDAYVVEMGEFLTLRGTVLNDPVLQEGMWFFDFEPAPGQGVVGVLQVLADRTRMFSVDGNELGLVDLAAGDKILVDGVLDTGPLLPQFKAALMIREMAVATMWEGILVGPSPLSDPLQVDISGVVRCVRSTADTDYYLLTVDSLTPMSFAQLALGDDLLVFGQEDAAGCLVAEDMFVRR